MRTAVVVLEVKDPDAFGDMRDELGLSEKKADKFLEFGEYAALELTVSEDMTFTGKFLPMGKRR